MLYLVYRGIKGITSLSVVKTVVPIKEGGISSFSFFSYLTFTHLEKGKTVLLIRDPDRFAPLSREVVCYTVAFYLQYRGLYTVTIDSTVQIHRQQERQLITA